MQRSDDRTALQISYLSCRARGSRGENEAHAALHEMVDYTPSYDIVPMPTKELPKICKDIPHIHASNLTIAPTSEDWYVQGAVNLSNSGDSIAYLKPRSIERAFEREISILAQIKASGLPSPGVRVPGLLGIVVTGEEGEEVVGMLITLVPSSSSENNHLLSPASWSLTSLHTKWENQVRRTVQALHQHGIIWGM
ncbi:hypothetical protein H2203_004705 [Taxawa tesnikishii (nom. ined.)]|nr:hypothetical protein H2203_004705 [Dothideales sp. JES 119]